eukprot:3703532-Amphidinium_carterae.2
MPYGGGFAGGSSEGLRPRPMDASLSFRPRTFFMVQVKHCSRAKKRQADAKKSTRGRPASLTSFPASP